MANQWLFKSETYDNCNCSVSCGCQFNEPTTHGNCQFAYVGTIVDGHFNETPLTGLNWALICKFPGEIAEGNGKRQIVIDERADDAQRRALETIISGKACKPLSNHFGCAQRSLVALTSPLELVFGLTAIAKTRPTSCWLAPPATLTSD